jgi:hypothetical protein
VYEIFAEGEITQLIDIEQFILIAPTANFSFRHYSDSTNIVFCPFLVRYLVAHLYRQKEIRQRNGNVKFF